MENTQTNHDATETSSNDDNWHLVKDAKKRKQIQDRLAQRARRMFNATSLRILLIAKFHGYVGTRIRDARKTAVQPIQDFQPLLEWDHPEIQNFLSTELNSVASLNTCGYTVSQIGIDCTPSVFPTEQPCTPHLEISVPLTVYAALLINGKILGLTCAVNIPRKSLPAAPEVPLSLYPTQTQLHTVHHTMIDRFPFPKARDNFINFSAIIDEEELCNDIFTMPSFTIRYGALPWDPAAWHIESAFAAKWGFVFCA